MLFSASYDAVRDCAGQVGPGDQVLLADQGVILLTDADRVRQLQACCGTNLRALHADATARGLQDLATALGVELIEDGAWVECALECPVALSWK